MIKKLSFPRKSCNVNCKVAFHNENISPMGGSEIASEWSGKVIFSEKSKQTLTTDKQLVMLEGKIVAEGDIAPILPVITGGDVEINNRTYQIFRAARTRNPDGSVYSTTLELV